MSVAERVQGVVGLALAPVDLVFGAPRAARHAAETTLRTARTTRAVVMDAAELLPRLIRLTVRAEHALDLLEPQVRRLAAGLDEAAVTDLVRAARSAPALVVAMNEAVAGFDVFLARADGVRDSAADVTARAAELTTEIRTLVGSVAGLVELAGTTVTSAAVTAGRADRVATDAEVLTQRVALAAGSAEDVVALVRGIADQAQQVAGTVEELTRRAQPVVEQSVELAEQSTDPARTLVDAASAVAPELARHAPELVRALAELANRLPELLNRFETQVLPMLDELESTPAHVRALKESVEEIEPKLDGMEAELAGIPGAKTLRRRGRRAQAAPDSDS